MKIAERKNNATSAANNVYFTTNTSSIAKVIIANFSLSSVMHI